MFSFSDRAVLTGFVVAALLTGNVRAQEVPTVTDPSKTIHGERSPRAPRELDVFAFLIGKWEGPLLVRGIRTTRFRKST